jgi:dUTP pyrophosphatase
MSYILKVKVNNPSVSIFYDQWSQHHEGDSGVDLIIPSDIIVSAVPFSCSTIDFGISCEMIDNKTNNNVSYYLVPRSSLAKTDFQMANSIGIIDAGYRGNLKAIVRNFNVHYSSTLSGSVFQIISPDLKPITVHVVETLSSTTRGSHGFGSTNKQ